MCSNTKSIYGIRIVPNCSPTGEPFGLFEGVVISCSLSSFYKIEIMRMVKQENGYFNKEWFSIPSAEVIDHSYTSGKDKAEFLLSKAKEFAREDEEIALSDSLVPHLLLLDKYWDELQKALNEE